MNTWYPEVLDEWATLDRVLRGMSIARFGDGELKLMQGRKCVSQVWVPRLATELHGIVSGPTTALVGIPTMDKAGPKYEKTWGRLKQHFAPFLSREKVYGSAFITRPDSAPWLACPAYFDAVQSLWKDQHVTFIGNGVRSLTAKFLRDTGASDVDWIECTYSNSYKEIDRLYMGAIKAKNHRVLLCAGATATCLAERLAKAGHHAIDLGHIGMFWRRYSEIKNWKEQREINIDTGELEPNP